MGAQPKKGPAHAGSVKGGAVWSLTSRFRNLLESRGIALRFKRGDLIYGVDDPTDMLYWIQKGHVKLSYLDETGRKLTLDILGEGQLFGESALARMKKRELLSEAIEDTEVIAVDPKRLLDQAKRDPRLMFEILTLMGRRTRNARRKLEDMAFKDLPTRLARALLHLAETHGIRTEEGIRLDCRLTHQDLADLVGATRTNVTMILGAFYQEGLLKKGRYLTIADVRRLEKRAYGIKVKRFN